MILQIDPGLPVPIYRQLTDQVVLRIAAGELRAGDQLPSIRKLATELRINPNTVIKAYRELEHQGYAASRHGLGFFVAEGGAASARSSGRESALGELRAAATKAVAMGLSKEEILAAAREATDSTTEGGSA